MKKWKDTFRIFKNKDGWFAEITIWDFCYKVETFIKKLLLRVSK